MPVNTTNETACGALGSPIVTVQRLPIIANRAPTTQDFAPLGTLWDFKAANQLWIISSIVNDNATWIPINQAPGALVVTQVQTVDATPTAVATYNLNPSNAIMLTAFIVAAEADYSHGGGASIMQSFRRGAAGAPMATGAQVDLYVDDDFGPNIDANFAIVGNAIQVQVTGIAATTINWKASLLTEQLP